MLQHLIKIYSQAINSKRNEFEVCLYLTAIAIGLFISSILSLIAVTVDRYRAICYPITYRNSTGTFSTKIIIICCWVLGITFGLLPAMGWNSSQYEGECTLAAVLDFNYLMACCVITGFGSTSIMIILYSLIYCRVSKFVSF